MPNNVFKGISLKLNLASGETVRFSCFGPKSAKQFESFLPRCTREVEEFPFYHKGVLECYMEHSPLGDEKDPRKVVTCIQIVIQKTLILLDGGGGDDEQ